MDVFFPPKLNDENETEYVILGVINSLLFKEKDRNLPYQFYQNCLDPSFIIDKDVLETLKGRYSTLFKDGKISSTAAGITLTLNVPEDLKTHVSAKPAGAPSSN